MGELLCLIRATNVPIRARAHKGASLRPEPVACPTVLVVHASPQSGEERAQEACTTVTTHASPIVGGAR